MKEEFSAAPAVSRVTDSEQATHPLDEFASTSPPPARHDAQ